MRTVRLFVSSPGDVDFERQRVELVAERLNGEFAQVVRFETIRWETKFYKAHENFQQQIPEAADCDIVIGVFWSRLGTELADTFPRLPDGTSYPSGSAYEVLTAIEARKAADRPDVYVFRKTERPTSRIDQDQELAHAKHQWERLEQFFKRWFHTPDGKFVGAYHSFRSTDDFEGQVETLLEDWVHEHFLAGKQIVWPIEVKGSPFRGLAPFEAKHASVFFGRTRKVMRAVEHLKDAARRSFESADDTAADASTRRLKPFLLIVGPSGAGKSSLMRAGLAPRLTTPGVVPEIDAWRTAITRPGDGSGPVDSLVQSLLITGGDDDAGGFGRAVPEVCHDENTTPALLAQMFAAEPSAAAAEVVAALDRVADEERQRGGFERTLRTDLLLLVDQLEDIFAANITDAKRSNFAHVLSSLSATKRVWVVATLRGDLYNRLIKNRAFIALKDAGHTYDLAPPGPDELGEIVQKSAEAAGLVYEVDPASGERLDDRLLADAEGKDILPLLEFTLDRLFEERQVAGEETRLTFASYQAMGGLDGAINQSAERALATLSEPEIAALPRLLRMLAVPVREDGAAAGGVAELTVHAVPIDAAVTDEASRRLVDALLEARIVLTSQSERPSGEEEQDDAAVDTERAEAAATGVLRIAHQRVFECWERARRIIHDNRDFYRIRNAVESQRRLWQSGGRSADLMIPDGRSLEEAESLVTRYGDELPRETRNFVDQSGRRARRNRKIKRAMQVALAVVAVVATGASVVATHFERRAVQNERQAVANYEAARETVDRLVTRIAESLRDLDRISVRTVDEALQTVIGLVNNLEASSGGDPLLKRTRAAMLYEFAKTFQSAEDRRRAFTEAMTSLSIREDLARLRASDLEWQWDLALSLDQVGDLHRSLEEFDAARERFDQALAIRRNLYRRQPLEPRWGHGLSLSLVRIGDLKFRPYNQAEAARDAYEEALTMSIEVFRRQPDAVRWQRELSWTFNKVGDIRLYFKNHAGALDAFEKSLCTRRNMARRDDKNTLWKSDVAYSLERISDVRIAEKSIAAAEEPVFEALGIRRQLVDSDRSHTLWSRELATTLNRIGDIKLDGDPALATGFFLLALDITSQVLLRVPGNRQASFQLERSRKGLARAGEKLNLPIDELLHDKQLRARAADEELKFERQILARQHDPLSCWNDLTATLGVSATARPPSGAM